MISLLSTLQHKTQEQPECFEYGQSKEDGQWYFQLKSPKGRLILYSDAYASKKECIHTIKSIQHFSQNANLIYREELEQF